MRTYPQPDFRRFLNAIWRREPDRVPIAELGIDPPVKEKLLGRPVREVKDDVDFWCRAGYDYIYLRPAYEFPHTMPSIMTTGAPKYGGEQAHEERRLVCRAVHLILAVFASVMGRWKPRRGDLNKFRARSACKSVVQEWIQKNNKIKQKMR